MATPDRPKSLSDMDLKKIAGGNSPLNPAGAKILAGIVLRAQKAFEKSHDLLADEGQDGDTAMTDIDHAEHMEHFSSYVLWGGEL